MDSIIYEWAVCSGLGSDARVWQLNGNASDNAEGRLLAPLLRPARAKMRVLGSRKDGLSTQIGEAARSVHKYALACGLS